ncbi:MAG: zinc ribbon domain-containing protein, partial [Planctomycetota bacterium]
MKIVYSFTLSGLFIALFSNAILTKEAKSESLYVPQEKDSPANIRENVNRNKLCPECSRIYPGDINFCSVDGKQLVDYREEDLMCPTCKEKATPGEKFCKNDGTQLVL